mgnify:CR=1 FL=1
MNADFVKYITTTCKDLMSMEEMIALALIEVENDEIKNATRFQYTGGNNDCLLYTSPSPRDGLLSRMPSSA